MTSLDELLLEKYKIMLGLPQITNVDGNTLLQQGLTVPSILTVNGDSNLKAVTATSVNVPTATVSDSLHVIGTSTVDQAATFGANVTVAGTTSLQGVTATTLDVPTANVSTLLNVTGSETISHSLTVGGTSSLQGVTATTVDVPNATVSSILHVRGTEIVDGAATSNSTLFIAAAATCASTLNVLGNATFANIATTGEQNSGNLAVNGTLTVVGDATLGTASVANLSISNSFTTSQELCAGALTVNGTSTLANASAQDFTVLGRLLNSLPHFDDNSKAKAGGVPINGFYRTGGIVKIRLDDVAPMLSLLGGTSVTIKQGNTLTDPGVTATDNIDTSVNVYMVSVGPTPVNIQIVGTSTVIPQASSLATGTYTLTYNATDSAGNVGSITRSLQIGISPVFTFSGGSLAANEYYCLHDKSQGKAWSGADASRSNFNLNQDYSNGLSVQLTLTNYTSSGANAAIFGFSVTRIYNGKAVWMQEGAEFAGRWALYGGYDTGATCLYNGGLVNGTHTWLISYNPSNGWGYVYKDNALVGSGDLKFAPNLIDKGGLWLNGRVENTPAMTITNVSVYNRYLTPSDLS